MALILAPAGNSANRTSGQVVKNIALKLYARGMLDTDRYLDGPIDPGKPLVAATTQTSAQEVGKRIGSSVKRLNADPAVGVETVPNVVGYDVASAVRMLEERGLSVNLTGTGRVVGQSLKPGTIIQPGSRILLHLRI